MPPPIVFVKSSDPTIKKAREIQVRQVLNWFNGLPDTRLLCFIDDEDCQEFKRLLGPSNRGFHKPLSDKSAFPGWPEYITGQIFFDDPTQFWFKRLFDHVVYLYGSTCENPMSLTMTLAHELQHVIQHENTPELLAASSIFRELPKELLQQHGFQWSDMPTEREARTVAKKAAIDLHGNEAVREFLLNRATTITDPAELLDVQFLQALDVAVPYSVKDETRKLYERFKPFREELQIANERLRADPDFKAIDLDSLIP